MRANVSFASGLRHASPERPRPVKRRCLFASGKNDHGDSSRSGTDVETDIESWSDSLPSQESISRHNNHGADDELLSDEDKPTTSKYRIYQPKFCTDQEPTFVTQLTQPPSSPYRIRGPRWKKPPHESAPASFIPPSVHIADNVQTREQNKEFSCSDEELRAAVMASLESFQEEEARFGGSGTVQNATSHNLDRPPPQGFTSAAQASCMEDFSFLDDLPEDAFDTSPDSSPKKTSSNPVLVSSGQTRPQSTQRLQGSTQQQKKRQTTLLGGFARTRTSSSQTASRNWPLASQSQAEPPTHHRLNPETLDCWVYPSNLGKRRDYQFNITQRALFHNILVALPTGLGKTFIAATVMLNWFRWTTEAQIVFVAPTKPLVAQQVDACFNVAGIPRSKTTMLTGEIPPGIREEEWKTKRVFFMTPQTVINDLKSGIADPKKIVLLVVDEAHRATGSYAYSQVVHFLRRFNNSFRVLALTATPGSTVEAVQEVIDNLNISRVEIRTERSLDIREYVHARNVEIQTFDNSEEMITVMELFAKTLQPAVDKLRTQNAHWARDPMSLTPYGLTVSRKKWMASPAGRNANPAVKGMVNALFTALASLAHSIDLLKYHGIGPFYRSLLSFEASARAGKGKNARQIVEDENFKIMMNKMRMWTNREEFIGHPKLEYLRQVVLNHFLDAGEGSEQANGRRSGTRVMIFAHFRDSAEEIARVLKRHEPLIRPRVFVGQANAKGSEGMDQKTQLEVVKQFKEGKYNTIVATSIGEEGLDIGEVDLIVCYDSSSSPIRMLQRMGRTGRKRQGNIVLLLMKGKEEESYVKARDNYEKMQEMIAAGDRFIYHTDKSPRILPREIQPFPEERVVEIPIENTQADLPEPKRRPGRVPKRGPKKFHMPDGVDTGFTTASRLGCGKETTESCDSNDCGDIPSLDEDSSEGALSGEEYAERPHPSDISLTPSQQADLAEELRTAAETAFAEPPRVDAFPTVQRILRPTRFVRHGRTTRGMVNALSTVAGMGSDCEDKCRKQVCSDDLVRYNSSPDASLNRRSRRRMRKRKSDVLSQESNGNHANEPDSYSPLMCSQSSRRRELNGKIEQPHDDLNDDSDIPDPDTLFNKYLSAYQPQRSSSQRSEDGGIDLDSSPASAPLVSTQPRNRYVISDDSDGY
ncbi:hypothetical protein VTO42DRAFT_7396 [Malbranchea cinnamomea]